MVKTGRKINEKLIEKMTIGDLNPLLNYLKSEKRLRLEVRRKGKCFVYYKKCKILELGVRSSHIDKKYFDNNEEPKNIMRMIVNKPEEYFKDSIKVVDHWLLTHPKKEFETQQNIALSNQGKNDKFLILDMEYNFSQEGVKKNNRVKQAGFDLLGIERKTGKVVFFEVKKGLKALTNKSGIKSHINDFEECLNGKNKEIFRKDLITDINNIISDKVKLGLIGEDNLPRNISTDNVELIFVFEPVDGEKNNYPEIFEKENKLANTNKEFKTIYVEKDMYQLD